MLQIRLCQMGDVGFDQMVASHSRIEEWNGHSHRGVTGEMLAMLAIMFWTVYDLFLRVRGTGLDSVSTLYHVGLETDWPWTSV